MEPVEIPVVEGVKRFLYRISFFSTAVSLVIGTALSPKLFSSLPGSPSSFGNDLLNTNKSRSYFTN